MSEIKRANGHRLDGVLPGLSPPLPGPNPTAEDVGFDLEPTLGAVRRLHSRVPADSYTAAGLGVEREGNAVVVDPNGLMVTIGYLIVEATEILVNGPGGKLVHAQTVGYDHETGFGLIRAVEPLEVAPVRFCENVAEVKKGDPVVIAAQGGVKQALLGEVADRREFAGSWEYMLDWAIFTTPLHPRWSGAALLHPDDGSLIGIGSLYVQDALENVGEAQPGNMFVPVDILTPIFGDMVQLGRPGRPTRPWLGMHVTEALGHLVVASVLDEGPADTAGVEPGDLVTAIEEDEVASLPAYYRRLWSAGSAGVDIRLRLVRGSRMMDIIVESADRQAYLKLPRRH